LCGGGGSTGPHVHFALLDNGAYSTLSGVYMNSHQVHPGRYSYDSHNSYMWIEKNSIYYYAYANVLYNDPPSTCDSYQLDQITISILTYSSVNIIVCSDTGINAGPDVTVDNNSDVIYRAPDVRLSPGFPVQVGGTLVIETH